MFSSRECLAKCQNMLAACFPLPNVSRDLGTRRKHGEHSLTTWYIGLPSESLQFLKEERTDGAIYNIYVKKVNYYTAPSVENNAESSPSTSLVHAKSVFYTDLKHEQEPEKAQLQWRLEEVRVIRYGTVECLVDGLASDTGELDSSYVNTFLATYRTFTTVAYVIRRLLSQYEVCCSDQTVNEVKKEAHKRSIRTVLSMWLEIYADDFREPPTYSTLNELLSFVNTYFPNTDLAIRCQEKIAGFQTAGDGETSASMDDVSLDFSSLSVGNAVSCDDCSSSDCYYVLDSVSSRKFAEQLTVTDAELFRNVVPHQCIGSIWSRRHESRKHAAQVASVYATVRQFNAVSYRVIASIIRQPKLTPGQRAAIIERWINIAQELRQLKNFSSLKAIISGLQSTSIYRLRKTWALVSRSKFALFEELAHIFSNEDNQRICREVLYREGTAKYADPNTVNDVCGSRGRRSQSSCLPSTWSRRSSISLSSYGVQSVQGTVPYLGTFLTDLMMIDSALKDVADDDDSLINFDKHRKEFEVLTQIRLLQSAASLYRIRSDPEFQKCFAGVRIYDDNKSYQMSKAIEPESPHATHLHTARRRRRNSSLGYFTARRQMSENSGASCAASVGCWPLMDPADTHSLRSFTNAMTYQSRVRADSRPVLRHCSSVGSVPLQTNVAADDDSKRMSTPESLVARVYLHTRDCDDTSQYKSILLNNCDHTQVVLNNVLSKYNVEASTDDYRLSQLLPDNTELLIPDDVNVFYAVNVHDSSSPIEFLVRRKAEGRHRHSRPISKFFS